MIKEIAEQWSKALRSGDYKQCTERLHKSDGHCCLGVLSELSGLGEWSPGEPTDEAGVFIYKGETTVLPIPVMVWAGMSNQEGAFKDDENNKQCLVSFNDGKKKFLDDPAIKQHSFNEIADIIDKNYEAL